MDKESAKDVSHMRENFIPYTKHDITEEDIDASVKALKSDWIATGPKIKEFENVFSNFIGCKYSIAVSSCTAALDLSLKVLGLPKGSEVITTPFTFVATSNSILYNNLKPVFCDIDHETFNIDPKQIEEKITDNTKAILCVDYAGQPCEYDRISNICKKNGLILLEDAAHAIGAEFDGKKVGRIAKLTSFSMHATKNITTGEGGVITTDDKNLFKNLLMLRSHGIDSDALTRKKQAKWEYDMKVLGYNYRMTDFQCAIGIEQMKRASQIIERRKTISDFYTREFSSSQEIITPRLHKKAKSAWHLYTILLENINRNRFYKFLRQKGIGANVHYIPVYRHSYYKKLFNFRPEEFPITEDTFKRILTLPLYQKMTDQDAQRVAKTVLEGVQKFS